MSSSGRTSQEHAQHEGVAGLLPSEEWSRTWPASGMAWCGTLSERPTSEPRTAASGSSSRLEEYGARLGLWESVTGLPMPEPEEDSPRGGRRLSAKFGEWMMGLPQRWVTGIRTIPRTAQFRILGNGVVPRQGRYAIHGLTSRALGVLA